MSPKSAQSAADVPQRLGHLLNSRGICTSFRSFHLLLLLLQLLLQLFLHLLLPSYFLFFCVIFFFDYLHVYLYDFFFTFFFSLPPLLLHHLRCFFNTSFFSVKFPAPPGAAPSPRRHLQKHSSYESVNYFLVTRRCLNTTLDIKDINKRSQIFAVRFNSEKRES